jgi:hypothetical protein
MENSGSSDSFHTSIRLLQLAQSTGYIAARGLARGLHTSAVNGIDKYGRGETACRALIMNVRPKSSTLSKCPLLIVYFSSSRSSYASYLCQAVTREYYQKSSETTRRGEYDGKTLASVADLCTAVHTKWQIEETSTSATLTPSISAP